MSSKKGYLYILITIVMFTSYEVVLKFISGQLNSMQLTLCRFAVGFVILLPLALHTLNKRGERLDGKSLAHFALLGLLGIALSMPILHVAVNYAGSSVAAVLFSCNPVFVTFLAFFLLKEPILPRHIAALVLEVAGTIAIINPFQTSVNLLGTGLALLSTILFSFYGVLGKRKCARYGGAVVTCFSFFFGSIILLVLILLSHIPAGPGPDGGGAVRFCQHPHFRRIYAGKPALCALCVCGCGWNRLLLLFSGHGISARQCGISGLLLQAGTGPGAGLVYTWGDHFPEYAAGHCPHRGRVAVRHCPRYSGGPAVRENVTGFRDYFRFHVHKGSWKYVSF